MLEQRSGSTRAASEVDGVACKHPRDIACFPLFAIKSVLKSQLGAPPLTPDPFRPQRSIRPQVVTTFELPGCHDMWTVISSEVKEDKKVPNLPGISCSLLHLYPDP